MALQWNSSIDHHAFCFQWIRRTIKQLYNSFDSDLHITIAEGKSFSNQEVKLDDLERSLE
ncbi:MAG: hypothetical protein IPN61_18740 [Bacteroidetes bacterium]|nr:hypothetical protein [Bacteroidota bacterium]